MIAPLHRLRQLRTREAYELAWVFSNRGSIVRPEEVLTLRHGQFEQIVNKIQCNGFEEVNSRQQDLKGIPSINDKQQGIGVTY